MPNDFLEWMTGTERETPGNGYSISPGIVTNNLDVLSEGRVQVRVPALPAFDLWARLVGTGAGSGRGFLWVPQIDDEVLVAFNQNDERDAYVIGGLWNTFDRPPLSLQTDFLIKRVLKTGLAGGVGHEVEFDDALQSITITSSTEQKIKIDPLAIELSNTAGTLTIKMDNATQTISINSALNLELKGTNVTIEGLAQVELKAPIVNVKADGICNIQGTLVKIN